MEILLGIIVFILGLCFGSFINMLVYRTAERYKLINNEKLIISDKGRSFCDYCGKQLKWYENIPVFSWLFLKGKTKCCHKKLPVSYPVVELTTGLLFLIFNSKFEIFNQIQIFNFQFLIGLLIIVLLVFSTAFDWKYMILPDFSTIILVSGALVLWFSGHFGEWNYFLSGLISAGFLLVLNLITKGKGMGMGDVKLAVFMGLLLGFPNIILAFYVAFIVGAIYGIGLMIFKKANKKKQVPFGPFLILGTLTAWWFGEKIVELIKLRL
ncbi:MAG: prepilin peptidase [Candidatus Shapirobacteria bacterium]|nr:prepilin peptidase [Candidatus Shapirobacteria bacterium]MDD4410380.1 prepilin peptidase [Candidatus Shapirobacteria bacterium]